MSDDIPESLLPKECPDCGEIMTLGQCFVCEDYYWRDRDYEQFGESAEQEKQWHGDVPSGSVKQW